MPYTETWVSPEVYLKHAGVTIWCTYKNDEEHNGPRRDFFTLNETCSGEKPCRYPSCRHLFDVTRLAGWQDPAHPPFLIGAAKTTENRKAWKDHDASGVEDKTRKAFLKKAIDKGVLRREGVAPRRRR